MKRSRTTRTTFKDPTATKLWLARANETWFCWEAAARLYREIGMEDDAARCDAAIARNKTVLE